MKPHFSSWSAETLAKFAEETYEKIKNQQECIEQLKLDLKTAMEQIRKMWGS